MMQDNDAIFRLSLEDSGVLTTCDIYALMQEDGESNNIPRVSSNV